MKGVPFLMSQSSGSPQVLSRSYLVSVERLPVSSCLALFLFLVLSSCMLSEEFLVLDPVGKSES